MKIEKKSKKNVGDLPSITQDLIRHILGNSVEEIVAEVKKVTVWRYGKCELYHWIDVLDTFDSILANVTEGHDTQKGFFMCPKLSDTTVKSQVLAVLNFTSLLIEHSYARHIYNSTEHLCVLLASPDLDVVLAVLNLLYVFGKRSNFISRLPTQQRNNLNSYLEFLGETWGGEKNGFGLARCCQDVSLDAFPSTASSVYFEYQPMDGKGDPVSDSTGVCSIAVNDVNKLTESVPELIDQLTQGHSIPPVHMMHLMTRLRLAKHFGSHRHRIQCVLVRLQAISVLVYSMAPAEVVDPLIYDGLVEELVEVLEMKGDSIQEVRAAVLRTLTAIIHLERDPRLGVIIEVTGATTYHGFLPTLVRECVVAITSAGPDGIHGNYPLSFATALFSFLYHLATYEASGDALVNSGVMESLLQVLQWRAIQPMNITLVTRAVRVIDLITNLDMTAFHSLGGWDKMLERLKMEIEECRVDVPTVLPSSVEPSQPEPVSMDTDAPPTSGIAPPVDGSEGVVEGSEIIQCMPERSALIKSILNFLKKAIPDPTFAENIRNFVNSSLPVSLAHITSNAEYYGASIYLPATEVATTFIFHDPSQLSSLQDNGLPWVMLNSLINKKIPVTREVLSALPNILSALCLNTRGLQTFIAAEPFDHLFGVLISPDYLPAMRRKRGNEALGDTANNLGGAMDELMRHQPLLRSSVMTSLIKLLKKLCVMGSTSPHQGEQPPIPQSKGGAGLEEGMTSDEEEDVSDDKEEEEEDGRGQTSAHKGKKKDSPLPLMEYTQNVVHFVDCILSTSSSDDHVKDFVKAGGLPPLLALFALPALPLNFPSSTACSSVISACKAVLDTAHEGQVLEEGLSQLTRILSELEGFINSPVAAKGSVLLKDLMSCPTPDHSQLLHNLTAAGSYIQLFIRLAKFPPGEARQICIKKWASPIGQKVLDQLSSLYRALVWEGFIVLAKASERESNKKEAETSSAQEMTTPPKSIPVSVINENKPNQEQSKTFVQTLKSFTPPLTVTSRVGRLLAELMSILVRVCSTPVQRPARRMGGVSHYPPSEEAVTVCMKMTEMLKDSLMWKVPLPSDVTDISDPDMKEWLFSGMTFKMYAVDFCLLLLFDEHKHAFHLMLHCFNEKGVLNSLISSFRSALDCLEEMREENNPCADYAVTSDFLEAWLNLAERLIDTESVIDSAHSINAPPNSEGKKQPKTGVWFDPLVFVIKAQKALLPWVRKLWPPVNVRSIMPEVIEHLMATITHFYSTEKVIKLKLAELDHVHKPAPPNNHVQPSATPSVIQPPRTDPLRLHQLMDMGFGREHAEEALLQNGGSLAAAMDWILTHPPLPSTPSQPQSLNEDELLAKAIAMSLEQEKGTKKGDQPLEDQGVGGALVPIPEEVLTEFSEDLLEFLLSVVPHVRDTVYRSCDLLVALIKRNGDMWMDRAISAVIEKALRSIRDLTQRITDGSFVIQGGVLDCDAHHICLLALLMEELPLSCGPLLCQAEFLEASIGLLGVAQRNLATMKREEYSRTNPMWIAPLLLILELWVTIDNLSRVDKPVPEDHQVVWVWFEAGAGRWSCYTPDLTSVIENAYQDGEPFAKISSGRQRFQIIFATMTQTNIDSGTRRQVVRLVVPTKTKEVEKDDNNHETDDLHSAYEAPSWYCRLSEEQAVTVVTYCTHLLSCKIDPDTLHANMRVLLLLTRNPLLAKTFTTERGPHALLALTQQSSFNGFSSLSSLLLRHVIEDHTLIERCIDSIIRGVLAGVLNDPKEIKAPNSERRDFDFLLRHLTACVGRDRRIFLKVASRTLQLSTEPPSNKDYLTQSRLQQILIRYVPPDKKDPPPLTPTQTNLLTLLIDHLCRAGFIEDGLTTSESSTSVTKMDEDTSDSTVLGLRYRLQVPQTRRSSYRRQVTDNDDEDEIRSEDMVLDVEPGLDPLVGVAQSSGVVPEDTSKTVKTGGEGDKKEPLPLFTQAAVLRFLAELIESYPVCAKVIIESSREVKIKNASNMNVSKEVSILAFILDYLLPSSYTQGASATQVAKLAKVFLQTLSSTGLPVDALNLFVAEFRAAFSRALLLPESLVKHQRVRALAGLLGQIVEPQTQSGFSSRSTVNPSQFVRMLIRKGFITDLSKALHCLDLSSPLLTTTINSILKPLECLTKIVTQFLASQKKGQKGPVSSSIITNPPPPPAPLPNPVSLTPQTTEGSGSNQLSTSNSTVVVSVGGSSDRNDSLMASPPHTANQSGNDTILETGDISLIPLVDDDHPVPMDPPVRREEERESDLIVNEAMSIARHLGMRARDVILGGDHHHHRCHGDEDGEDDEDDAMDIQEIVDELLVRPPGNSGMGPHALVEEDHADVTVSGSDLSDGSDEEEMDNYNSAGEEIEEDDFDDIQNDFSPKDDMELEDDIPDDSLEDTSSSHVSTEVIEEDEQNISNADEDSEDEEFDTSEEDGEESEEEEDVEETMEEVDGLVGEGGRDDTFDLDEEEEDDEDEGNVLDLDYHELDMMDHDDYIHIDMPSLGFGMRDMDAMDSHPYLGGFHSLLSRAYHIRGPSSMEVILSSANTSTIPQQHPLLVRYADHPRNPSLGETQTPTLPSARTTTPADVQRSNIVQQLLTNISTSVGTEEILSFNVGGSNPRQTNVVHAPDPESYISSGRSEDTAMESTLIPDILARWREESTTLDGTTANLGVANIRPQLLTALLKQYKEQQALKKSTASNKKHESMSTGVSKPPSQTITVPNPSDETTPSTATPRSESATSTDQLRAVASILSQMDPNSRQVTTSSSTLEITGEEMRTDTGTTRAESSGGLATGTPRSAPDFSMFDGSPESARLILARLSPNDPLYTFLAAVAGAPAPPLSETRSDHAQLSVVSIPSVPPPTTIQSPSTNSSLQVSVIQNPRPSEQANAHLPRPSIPQLSTQQINRMATTITGVVMNQLGSQSNDTNIAQRLTGEIGQAITDRLALLNTAPPVSSSSAHPQSDPNDIVEMLTDEIGEAIMDHFATPTTSSSALFTPFVPPTSSPSPSDTLAPMLSSLQMPNQQQTGPLVPSEQETTTSTTGQNSSQTSQSTSTTGQTSISATNTTSSIHSVPSVTSSSPSLPNTSSSTSQTGLTTSTTPTNDLPEGIDPTFLAALPDSMRQEVIAQYEREQRQHQRRQGEQQGGGATVSSSQDISPEVLAALPPEIQEEVLQQQRLDEARRSATTSDPSQVDPTSFITSLTPDLRRTILSDMDDTQIAQLPEEIAGEARSLRRERDERSRQLLALHHARYESQLLDAPQWSHSVSHAHPIGGMIPSGNRFHGYTVLGLSSDRIYDRFGGSRFSHMSHPLMLQRNVAGTDLSGKQILDQEGLGCLLVILFLDQSKIHFNRLFRIFRNLSQHMPSRSWLVSSLLSVLKKTDTHTCPGPGQFPGTTNRSHWLNMTISAALGSHVSVFQFTPVAGKAQVNDVHMHPHAAISICSNVLELLIFLARQFPTSFLPQDLIPKDKQTGEHPDEQQSNFWHILFKLDSSPHKGKGSAKVTPSHLESTSSSHPVDIFASSPIGSLMRYFDHPVVQGSVSLVDKLLRVLSVISGSIPKQGLVKTDTTAKDDPKKDPVAAKPTDSATTAEHRGLEMSETPLEPARPPCYSTSVVSVSLLNSVINLLTSGKCTEDCLDDATNLLINLSRCSPSTREAILLVLLEGVQKIGRLLSNQISILLTELTDKMSSLSYNRQISGENGKGTSAFAPSLGTTEGVILPTLQGRGRVTDHSQDLHIPCMEPLVCKGSQQSFFLRLLKVVCQLRESSQSILSAPRRGESSSSLSSLLLSQSPMLLGNEGSVAPTQGGASSMDEDKKQTSSAQSPFTCSLSLQLELEELWVSLSNCLDALADTYDPHAVLVLQSTVEAFFLVHADQSEEVRLSAKEKRSSGRGRRLPSFHTISDTESNVGSPAPYDSFSPAPITPGPLDTEPSDPYINLPPDTARFLKFAERHRMVLNQILRQSTIPLSEGPFAVLVNHTRLLDFDVKRRYFRQELEQLDEGLRRDDVVIHVRRDHVFEDSYRELYRRSTDELKGNLYITFEGEEGQDAGGLLREWYLIIAREMFNPNYALFKTTPGDRVTYMPNPSSHINPDHLSYFRFVGRIIAKAVYDNKLLDCYFTRSFYKHILGKPVHYTDMESEDYAFYQGMVYLLEHDLNEIGMDLTFSTEIEEFGKTELRDLKPKGRELPVTESNKREYVQLACQLKMTGSIRLQIKSFLDGYYEVIPKSLISIFNEQELELLISGLPNFDIDDLKANTEYHKYTESSLQIQWFWRALRSYSQADKARFLQFVTGTSKVPLQGFVALEGMNGIQKFQIHRDDRSTDRLPAAHTCFNHLDLPPYETYDKLNHMLLTAIQECPEGFGFA